MATRPSTPRKLLQLAAVATAISASCWALGFGLTAQSAKQRMPFSPNSGFLVIIRKTEETVLMPGAVPMHWKAARNTSPVVLKAPATAPPASPTRTIIAP